MVPRSGWVGVALAALVGTAGAEWKEPPSLAAQVAAGTLPAVAERLPAEPAVERFAAAWREPGRYGGELRLLMGRSKDTRLMVVYGYARLVAYDLDYELVPDILADVQVRDEREFTLKLRKGHRWSDGQPFTSEDFRYFWQDIATNEELSPFGPPAALLVEGVAPQFEVLDETTVRYTWPRPNPFFLTSLALASPQFIYAPAHYLKQFHASYGNREALDAAARAGGQKAWTSVHINKWRPYKNNNPQLPSLQPWVLRTKPPSTRFVFDRNPFFHRVDEHGHQLPYLERVVMNIADGKLIPTKAGAGETDLQARSLSFSDFTFLKESERRGDVRVRLWSTTKGSHIGLFPNLNAVDPVWRKLLRDRRFRRALSLAVDRHEINQLLYFGLAVEGNNTVQAGGPLFDDALRTRWATFDLKRANALLDEIGLTQRDGDGIRLLPDGRPLQIVVETAGEDTEQTDVLELIRGTWRKAGIKLFSKPMQREVFRNRIYAGETLMAVWGGLENGLPTPDMSPEELAPIRQDQVQWPKWGQHRETKGAAGEPVDVPEAQRLLTLYGEWLDASTRAARAAAWREMLQIHADQTFTIGLVSSVPQPVVVDNDLRNVPDKGVYNWDPGAHFGIYRPDTFWFGKEL
jgi:peptide/nickel transport system substrate-binding protein